MSTYSDLEDQITRQIASLEYAAGSADRHRKQQRRFHVARIKTAVISIAAFLALMFGITVATAVAGDNPGGNDAPVNISTEIHGSPGNAPAFNNQGDDRGACPAGAGAECDGGQHGIGNNPGQSGVSPAERRAAGDCVAEQMHGGIEVVNPTC